MSEQALLIPEFPDRQPSERYQVTVEGRPVQVHQTPACHFALFQGFGEVDVRVAVSEPFETCKIRPGRLGLEPKRLGEQLLNIRLSLPCKVTLEFDGNLKTPLFLLCSPMPASMPECVPESMPASMSECIPENLSENIPEILPGCMQENTPEPDADLIRFGPGFHEAGEILLYSGQTLLLESGAWVHGRIRMDGGENIRICGSGILDASNPAILNDRDTRSERHHAILPTRCRDIRIEGITVLGAPTWHVVPVACESVQIQGLNIIGHLGTGDGIDLVGCRDVTVSDCFVRVKDDCVAIKAVDYQFPFGEVDVARVTVERCVFWNDTWGNVMEIGYETRCAEIHDIVFRDIDVVHCEYEGWQSGGVFTIHNGDRADIHDILYENIRVECADEKLIDFKILDSRYSKDKQRGRIRNVVLRDISVMDGPFPMSVLRGWEAEQMVENIRIERLTILGNPVRNWREARMLLEITKDIVFV